MIICGVLRMATKFACFASVCVLRSFLFFFGRGKTSKLTIMLQTTAGNKKVEIMLRSYFLTNVDKRSESVFCLRTSEMVEICRITSTVFGGLRCLRGE